MTALVLTSIRVPQIIGNFIVFGQSIIVYFLIFFDIINFVPFLQENLHKVVINKKNITKNGYVFL